MSFQTVDVQLTSPILYHDKLNTDNVLFDGPREVHQLTTGQKAS